MRFVAQLTESTGTFWIDDVDVRIVQTIPEVDLTGIENPVILPQPLQMRSSKEKRDLGTVGVINIGTDDALKTAIETYFDEIGVSYQFVNPNDATDTFDTLLIIGDDTQATVNQRFNLLYAEKSWDDLGEEG